MIIKPKAFKKDKIQLSDDFLKNIIPYFTSRDPNLKGTPVEIFLALNRKQRELDAAVGQIQPDFGNCGGFGDIDVGPNGKNVA